LALIGAAAQLGGWYTGSLAATTALLVFQRILIKDREPDKCFRAFLNHQYVGAAIFSGIALNYLFNGGG
jgi:4-hydroxybenzoate polyprenyltransferase